MDFTFPKDIYSGAYKTGHCQGIAVDPERGFVYYSFTTAIIKTDLAGNLIGSAYGLLGHLGCIAYSRTDNRVYGSLEYKNDAIGRGILRANGQESIEDAFYIAIIDCEKLNRPDMDAVTDGVMTAVYLRDVVEDYHAFVMADGKETEHRYGCSGIDGLTIAPVPGSDGPADHVLVAYGIYNDVNRSDNDHQVLLSYPLDSLEKYAAPLSQNKMHQSGPDAPEAKYFVFTGNTNWGIQNMEYDAYTGNIFACVYPGKKEKFPNPPMFVIDGHTAPQKQMLTGLAEEGLVLTLEASTGLNGLPFGYGSTGICSFGNGYFAVSHDGRTEEGHITHVRLYRLENNRFVMEE